VAEASNRPWRTVCPRVPNWITGRRRTELSTYADDVVRRRFPEDTTGEVRLVEICGYPVEMIVDILNKVDLLGTRTARDAHLIRLQGCNHGERGIQRTRWRYHPQSPMFSQQPRLSSSQTCPLPRISRLQGHVRHSPTKTGCVKRRHRGHRRDRSTTGPCSRPEAHLASVPPPKVDSPDLLVEGLVITNKYDVGGVWAR